MPRLTEQEQQEIVRFIKADRPLSDKYRTKKTRSLELTSVFHECPPGRRKIAVKVVDRSIVEVAVGGKK